MHSAGIGGGEVRPPTANLNEHSKAQEFSRKGPFPVLVLKVQNNPEASGLDLKDAIVEGFVIGWPSRYQFGNGPCYVVKNSYVDGRRPFTYLIPAREEKGMMFRRALFMEKGVNRIEIFGDPGTGQFDEQTCKLPGPHKSRSVLTIDVKEVACTLAKKDVRPGSDILRKAKELAERFCSELSAPSSPPSVK